VSPSAELLDRAFSALADPTRRAIIERLAEGPATVGELARPFDMSLPAISKHLTVLERARLIRREPEAQRRLCSLEPDGLRTGGVESWHRPQRAKEAQRPRQMEKLIAS
jgi:DNA-binding transcriptional ArsR family regulator